MIDYNFDYEITEEFQYIIKDDLCDGLFNNFASVDAEIFKVSGDIFVKLLEKLRVKLKSEISVFISDIFIKIIESNTSSYNQKLYSLKILSHLLSNPKFVIEFFINYDCDIDYTNILERYIIDRFRVIHGR